MTPGGGGALKTIRRKRTHIGRISYITRKKKEVCGKPGIRYVGLRSNLLVWGKRRKLESAPLYQSATKWLNRVNSIVDGHPDCQGLSRLLRQVRSFFFFSFWFFECHLPLLCPLVAPYHRICVWPVIWHSAVTGCIVGLDSPPWKPRHSRRCSGRDVQIGEGQRHFERPEKESHLVSLTG